MLEALAAAWAPRQRLALCLILVFHLCHSGVPKCAAQAPAAAPAQPSIIPPADRQLPAEEKSALKAIAKKLNISTSVWNFSTNPCSETGGWLRVDKSSTPELITNVTCGNCNTTSNVCHVISVMLKTTNLVGVIPEEFSNLSRLVQLDLSRNYLHGSIPGSLAKLPLINLTLVGNRLTGKIPTEIGNMKTLQSIVLENNLLEGPLPPSLGNLTSLRRLLLSANNFVGKLPDSLGNLKNLTDFRIDGTNITGNIPDFIGNWTQLTRLDMQGTSLEGSFPRAFSTLAKLEELRVTDFKGDGTFPRLNILENIKQLILRNCSINGQIPDYLGELKNLKTLDLSFNNLSGEIPNTFSSMVAAKGTNIKFLYLTSNKLVGNIPEAFFRTKINIDLSYNQFSGPSKDGCQASNVNLVSSMESSQNSVMTPCLKKNYPCSDVARNYQLFINCGGPRMTINGTEYVADDRDTVGESLFSGNGSWALSSTGDFVGNENARYLMTNTSILKTSSDLYSTARGSASSLKYYGLCLQTGNYTVKLHFAEIIFRDDNTYYSVGRRFFDVMIQGKKVLEDFNIADEAKGVGREIVKKFIAEVENTLEIEFRWSGKGTNAIPDRGNYGPLISAISVEPFNFTPRTNFNDFNESKGLSGGAIAGIVIGCCVAVLLIVVIPFILLRKKEQENEELRQLKLQGAFFSLKQIKVATKNFDLQNKIGEGGFGPVYKGVLPDGSVVAVKQLSSKSKQGNREFVNEIGMISALQHPNLVRLFGCCIESNQLLLVYEYLENNSLARALFGPEATRLKLDWQRRHMITLDIARGLAYLHEESRLKIVHRDIKATNILLDKDLNAKISDFGLAKLDDEENTHISTRIAGTIGYMAPEYAMRGYLTEKVDVYSFGIVLLEIVSGKSNTNYRPKEDFVYLLDWAYVLKDKGNLLELVDPSLGTNFPQAEAEQLLNLALMCANPSPTLRPTMTSVVSMIEAGTLVSAPSAAPIRTLSDEMRFKAFEKLSYDTQALSTDGPWMNSSVTMSTNPDLTETSSTSRLIDDTSMASV